jgi:colicin import membrane protein
VKVEPADRRQTALVWSIGLHLLLVGAVAATYLWMGQAKPDLQPLAIEAVVVTTTPTAVAADRDRSAERDEQAKAEAQQRARESAKAAEAEAEAARAAEIAAKEAAKAQEEAAATAAANAKAQAEAEAQLKAKALTEAKAKKDAELAAEKAAKDAEKAAKASADREADLKAQIAAEEKLAAARTSSLMSLYVGQITARIERAWIRPAGAAVGLECEVRVTQVPGGAVTAVQIARCNGDESVRQSIEAAVFRASPLPSPPSPDLFERILVVTFRPRD